METHDPVSADEAAAGAGSKFASWPPAVAAVLVFLVFAGTGLTMSARATRP